METGTDLGQLFPGTRLSKNTDELYALAGNFQINATVNISTFEKLSVNL